LKPGSSDPLLFGNRKTSVKSSPFLSSIGLITVKCDDISWFNLKKFASIRREKGRNEKLIILMIQ
jgi:hypothetical protein